MAYDKMFKFPAAVNGYHYSQQSQILQCFIERDNPTDCSAIKAYKNCREPPAYHLPTVISRL